MAHHRLGQLLSRARLRVLKAATVLLGWGVLTQATPAAAQDPMLLLPGDALVGVDRAPLGLDTTFVSMVSGGQATPTAIQIEERARIRDDGRDVLRQVIRVERPGAGLLLADTTWHTLPGLRPLRHRSHGRGRVLTLEYAPEEVRGTQAPESAETESIRIPLDGPVFDPSASMLVVQTLPLEPGLRLTIPFVNHEQRSVQRHEIHVVGKETVSGAGVAEVSAWRLHVRLPDGRELTYWLEPDSHRLVLGRASAGPGREMIMHPPGRPPLQP